MSLNLFQSLRIIGLDLDDFDFNEMTVLIHGKGQKERLLPIPKDVLPVLQKYIEEIRPKMRGAKKHRDLFLNTYGTPMAVRSLQKMFRKYADKAGLHNFTSHSLRKGCTTRLIKGGANVYIVQKFLGHASLNTIEHYAKLDVEDLRRIIEE